jgi:release factor glutamine methyltransferase
MTTCQITEEIRRQLAGQYPVTEIESFIRILFGNYLNMNSLQIYLSHDHELPPGAEPQIRAAIDDLKKYRPIQYILGETEFYGFKFEVTPDVLIPRPETEELVDWVLHEYDKNAALSIVDIGAGSGCIAVALAAGFRNAGVWAVDISEAALAVARRNTLKNRVKVHFLQKDVLKDDLTDFEPASLDVIVSNPPYVTLPEKRQIQPNVLEYEPHQALFTPGHDALIFYKRIAAFGTKGLKPHGKVFFEINEAFPAEVAEILKQHGYSDIVTRKDINGKWRMISAQK